MSSSYYIPLPHEEVRICLAEDNLVNQRLFAKILEKLCYTNLHIYPNGQDAVDGILQRAEEGEPYHIVFMDTAMPVMDGFEATRRIRASAIEAVRDVSIVVLSPSMYSTPVDKLHALGVKDILAKPIRKQDITRTLEAYHPQELIVPEVEPVVEVAEDVNQESSSLRPRL